jgi:hypothetical protein
MKTSTDGRSEDVAEGIVIPSAIVRAGSALVGRWGISDQLG